MYVRLGYEFNIACRAFNGIGVDTSDLGPVPELLRAILEETLSQEASSASLDRFLPRIRDIIITLLHGLKRKQQRLRAKQVKDNAPNGGGVGHSASSNTLHSGLSQMLEDVPSRTVNGRGSERRSGSGGSRQIGDMMAVDPINGEGEAVSPRYSSFPPARHNSGGGPGESFNRSLIRDNQRQIPGSQSGSSFSSTTSQSTSVLADNDSPPAQQISSIQRPPFHRDAESSIQPPPPPPPKQQDALAALQRGGDLERRASRRYSAYQISKHLGASPNGVPMLPPTQNSPIPNRGRDVRESMNAVRTRGSGILSRKQSSHRARTPSPVRQHTLANRISEESSFSNDARNANLQADVPGSEGLIPAEQSPNNERLKMGATLVGPVDGMPAYNATENPDLDPTKRPQRTIVDQGSVSSQSTEGSQTTQQFVPEQSPQPGKELTLFLQYKSKIKKFVLPEGSNDLSLARLQLAFIEKFAWNTHSNGNDLPEIYIQDPVSGVRHELEDLRDVKDRSVLVLNIEVLDEVKKHIDEGLGGLRRMMEGVRSVVDSQQTAIQRVSERQQDASKELTRISMTPKPTPSLGRSFDKPKVNGIVSPTSSKIMESPAAQIASVRDLRQDLAVVRQNLSSFVADVNTSMSTVQSNASIIKTMAINGVTPDLDPSSGRSYVNTGKKALGEESENIVNRVDDLQDIVEDLRKDVVLRGVRPLPRQLETVSKSISSATADLKKMQEFLRREKPIWTKIWEKELELVCTDRDLLTMQEELAADLEDDLDKATQTFALVEQATKQQNLQSNQGNGVTLRSTSKGLAAIASDQDIDPKKAKDGVLGEVRALRPNHETRLEAIERAEKARQRELENRREGEFTREVANFVEEGKLKKSGGVEETERQRKARDERNMREGFALQQERAAGKGKKGENAEAAPTSRESAPEEGEARAEGQAEDLEETDAVPEMQDQAKRVEGGEYIS